jgi:hypothetical protein
MYRESIWKLYDAIEQVPVDLILEYTDVGGEGSRGGEGRFITEHIMQILN